MICIIRRAKTWLVKNSQGKYKEAKNLTAPRPRRPIKDTIKVLKFEKAYYN